MNEPSPFELLGVKPGATAEEVRTAYRRMVKSCHPDQFQDAAQQRAAQEKLIKLNISYCIPIIKVISLKFIISQNLHSKASADIDKNSAYPTCSDNSNGFPV